MRKLAFNGYIDSERLFGDEITPEMFHAMLYGESGELKDDVTITLNSFGGGCNAATQMYDAMRAYPGKVRVVVSGTAASAGTVVASAADVLEMTPGSLWMVHDPSTMAWGDEEALMQSVNMLRATKESIVNIYARRCQRPRAEIARLMNEATWMDAGAALAYGFIDRISDQGTNSGAVADSAAPAPIAPEAAQARVNAFLERRMIQQPQCPWPAPKARRPGVPYGQLCKRLKRLKRT